jgi:hypothetical protein
MFNWYIKERTAFIIFSMIVATLLILSVISFCTGFGTEFFFISIVVFSLIYVVWGIIEIYLFFQKYSKKLLRKNRQIKK